MRQTVKRVFVTALVLGHTAVAFASDRSVTVFPAEGNKQCSDYAANSVILQMGTSSPQGTGTVMGPDSPADANTTGESASYAIGGGTVASFSAATTPVDFAILKSNRNISVIIYPAGGVTADANMTLPVNGQPQVISAISLCYGLGNSAPPPPVASTVKSCNIDNVLDQTGVMCPATGRALVCNFELDLPFYGLNNQDSCCVCNTGGELPECDPAAVAGAPNACTLTTAEKAALEAANGTPVETEVTTHIELNNDPYFCTTVGGIRKCYAY